MSTNEKQDGAAALRKHYMRLATVARRQALAQEAYAASEKTAKQQAALALEEHVRDELRQALMQVRLLEALARVRRQIARMGSGKAAQELRGAYDTLVREVHRDELAFPQADAGARRTTGN